MAWQIFGTLAAGNQNASLFDTLSGQIAINTIVKCGAAGTNAITLTTDASNGPPVPAYVNQQHFSFVAVNSSSAAVTVQVGALGALKLFWSDGTSQLGSGDIVSGREYVVSYNAALDSAAGGFFVTAPTRVSSGNVLLATLTASNSASLVDTTSLTATYQNYLIMFDDIVAASSGTTFLLEYSIDGGANYLAVNYLSQQWGWGSNGGFGINLVTTYIILSGLGEADNAAGSSVAGSAIIYNPSGTTRFKHAVGLSSCINVTGGRMAGFSFNGCYNGGFDAVNAIRFRMLSGNITSGTVKIYGIP